MRIIIVNLISFLSIVNTYSQDLPDIGEIFSISPEWSYISVDTNWYPVADGHPSWDEYGGRYAIHDEIEGDNYYFLEYCFSFYNWLYRDGYFLHKIDIVTGELEWVHRSNYFSGNEYIVSSFVGDFSLSDKGLVHVNGFKSRKSFDELQESPGYYINTMQNRIDKDDGELVQELVDTTTLDLRKHVHQGVVVKSLSDDYKLKYLTEAVFEDGFVKTKLHTYLIDPEGNEALDPSFSYTYNTQVDFDVTAVIPFAGYYIKINNNKGVAFFGSENPSVGNQPTDISLVFIDTSEPTDISVSKTVNATQYSPPNQIGSTYDPFIEVGKDKVYLWQKPKLENGDTYIWMAIYNEEGELERHIDRLTIDGNDIDIFSTVSSFDDRNYLLGIAFNDESETNDKYYIFYFDEKNNPIVISEFSKNLGFEEYFTLIPKLNLLPNNDLLMYTRTRYPWNDINKTFSGVHRFSAEELGITTNVIEVAEESRLEYVLSPNPAEDMLKIEGDLHDISELYLSTIDGKTNRIDFLGESQITISHLIPGQYYLKISTKSGDAHALPFLKI